MDNKDINDIKLLLYDILDQQKMQNEYLNNVNKFIGLIIFIYIFRIVFIIICLILILNYGIDLFNNISVL